MIYDNPVFWQAVLFMLWGYVFSWVVYGITAMPSRLIESA